MSTVANPPIYKVGMTVRVTEKKQLNYPKGWSKDGKITKIGDRIYVNGANDYWCIKTDGTSQYNLEILGPMAAETKTHIEDYILTCPECGFSNLYCRPGLCASKMSQGQARAYRINPDCPECKGTGTWTNPANAATTPCSMGCGG